jgi:hypothetical protein
MSGDPFVHFSYVRRSFINTKKLTSIRSTTLRHESGLIVNRSPAASDANMSLGELPLHHANERLDIGRTRLRSTMRVSCLIYAMRRRMPVMPMCMVMMSVLRTYGFW